MMLLINDINIIVHAVTKLVMLTSHALSYIAMMHDLLLAM